MMRILIVTILMFPLGVYAQNGIPIFHIEEGKITPNEQFIAQQTVDSETYTLLNPISTTVGHTDYSIETGTFDGWENDPGDYQVIRITGNNQQFVYQSNKGIVKYGGSKEKRIYASKYRSCTDNDFFIEVPLSDSSKALIFMGVSYPTDLPQLIIFVLTEEDVELVYNKPMEVLSITMATSDFSMDLQSNSIEWEDPAMTHTIRLQNRTLWFKDN